MYIHLKFAVTSILAEKKSNKRLAIFTTFGENSKILSSSFSFNPSAFVAFSLKVDFLTSN